MSIIIEKLGKKFGPHYVFQNLSFEIPNTGLHYLEGANGSGKTTIFKILMGLLREDNGKIRLNGELLPKLPYQRARIGFAYFPQESSLIMAETIQRNYELHTSYLKKANLLCEPKVDSLVENKIQTLMKKKAFQLSRGQAKLTEFYFLLHHSARFFFLDEPLSGCDEATKSFLRKKIRELSQHTSVLFSEHTIEDSFAKDVVTNILITPN